MPLFEEPETQTVEGVVLSTFDYSKISKTQILEDFEKADIFQIIDSMIERQGYNRLTSEGIDDMMEVQKGRIHFSIASNKRLPFFPHASILFSMIRKLTNFKNVRSCDFPMASILTLLGDHLLKLFASYDRGRARNVKREGNWMIDELKIANIVEDRNYDINEAIEVCQIQTGYNREKHEKLE